MTTIVTALYDIGREKNGDGRSINQYSEWLDKTLQLNTNFILFTEKNIYDSFLKEKKYNNVKIILQDIQNIPYYKYVREIETIIKEEQYKKKMRDCTRIECNIPLYNCIQYSKFEWIAYAIENHCDATESIFWMDAGCSRFFDKVDISQSWPNFSVNQTEKFIIQGNYNTQKYINNWPGSDDYIWDNNCILVGTLFGGKTKICLKIRDLVKNKFEYYLNKNIVNNEQIILGILYKEYPELFNVYIELNGKHLPLFKKLAD